MRLIATVIVAALLAGSAAAAAEGKMRPVRRGADQPAQRSGAKSGQM